MSQPRRMRSVRTRLTASAALVAALAGCGPQAPAGTAPPAAAATPAGDAAAAALNSTDPRWMLQHSPRADVAVVFIHGLFGDTVGTWTHAPDASMFSFVEADPRLGPKVDLLAFGYTSTMLREGSLDIQEAANRLHSQLQFHRVLEYPAIVFVTHSMGGLVALREVLMHREILPQVKGLVLFATPQEGSQISSIARVVANNGAIDQLLPADKNAFLRQLNDDWISLPNRPQVHCAYEKLPTRGVMIVSWESATRFCDRTSDPIDADHIGIVKPDRPMHGAMVTLANALDTFVLNKALTPVLELPDFVTEGPLRVFPMTEPGGRSRARLVNAGGSPLRITVAQVDPDLFVWPDDTPKVIPANDRIDMHLALGFGARATAYRFTLTSDVTPPTPVEVRVDPARLQAARAALAAEVSTTVTALLERDGPALRAAPAGSPVVLDAVTQAARDVVAARSPGLPEAATWVITADLMDAGNWHGLAIRALRRAEAASATTVQTPSVQRLAGIVAARAGEPRVFATAPTPPPQPAEDRPQPFADPAAAGPATALSKVMRDIPALRGQGLSLEGDLQRAKGNRADAQRFYGEAAAIRATPSVKLRIDRVQRPNR